MDSNNITVRLSARNDTLLPEKQTDHSAGFDLKADIGEPVMLAPGERRLVPSGIFMEIPAGYEGQVRPRSGLAIKHGITLLNTPGTIDADYRGEVKLIVYNAGNVSYTISPGERIAQIVIQHLPEVQFVSVDSLSETERGSGGFGSTG